MPWGLIFGGCLNKRDSSFFMSYNFCNFEKPGLYGFDSIGCGMYKHAVRCVISTFRKEPARENLNTQHLNGNTQLAMAA